MEIHVASKELDLEGHNSLGDPDCREHAAENERALVVACVDGEEEGQEQAEEQRSPKKYVSAALHASDPHVYIPKIPIPQTLAHATLQNRIRIWPPANNAAKVSHSRHTATQTISLASLGTSHAAALVQHATQEVLGPQHLAHLLPHGEQVAAQSFPHGLVERADGRAAILARNGGVQVALGVVGGAGVGARLVRGDVAC